MTRHPLGQPVRTPAVRPRPPHPPRRTGADAARHEGPPPPALPPAFEAFCALHRDCYLAYARVHLPEEEAHRVVRGALNELAVRWPYVVAQHRPATPAWALVSARIRARHPRPAPLDACPPVQYDALVLHCLLEYSSTAAAETMGLEPSKIRYLVYSASAPARTAARRLRPGAEQG
ncbi:hypothetical protein ACIHAA_30790 [Streptomyces sp. NPDC052040]|uniref:hypothetical protein n=1 Tax=Streptomyces sp. NPDC052040 TaxID=3365682 RepID=UPI0037D0FC5E